ncbi:MAG TPA: helix-turn-helix domain-containing protein [Oligoflexia bacterium]|nr:helix-turn-helix domain-containing protein [Oligoflexia bacterium]
MKEGHYVIDAERLSRALRDKGFRSFRELARELKLHRNTISNYLTGGPVLPDALERILSRLELTPGEVLKHSAPRRKVPGLEIAEFAAQLNRTDPDAVFVLFGSRSRGSAKRFSDYDIGIFKSTGLEFAAYSRLLNIAADWNEQQIPEVQLVNLNAADDGFLGAIRDDMKFLSGSLLEWTLLQKRCGIIVEHG